MMVKEGVKGSVLASYVTSEFMLIVALGSGEGKPVSELWVHRFRKRHPDRID